MTKNEKKYLQQQVTHNKEIIKQVESGEIWDEIFKTPEQKLAFTQGIAYVNDVLDAFING